MVAADPMLTMYELMKTLPYVVSEGIPVYAIHRPDYALGREHLWLMYGGGVTPDDYGSYTRTIIDVKHIGDSAAPGSTVNASYTENMYGLAVATEHDVQISREIQALGRQYVSSDFFPDGGRALFISARLVTGPFHIAEDGDANVQGDIRPFVLRSWEIMVGSDLI